MSIDKLREQILKLWTFKTVECSFLRCCSEQGRCKEGCPMKPVGKTIDLLSKQSVLELLNKIEEIK